MATVQAILDSASQSTGQSALQSALQSVLDLGSQMIPKATIQRILESHPAPPPAELVREPTPNTRPIWPGRIELIYKQYIVEKEAWLTAHPTVRPSNYRKREALSLIVLGGAKSNHAIFQITVLTLKQRLPYLLAYKPPLCGPCETNALSQEGAYSKGGLISQISGTVLSKH